MRKRVLQVVADGSPGGGTTHVLQIIKGLGEEFEMGLVTQVSSYLSSEAARYSAEIYTLDFFRSRFDLHVSLGLKRVLRDFRPHLVHLHGGRAGFFFSFVAGNVPIIYTVHGLHFAHKKVPQRFLGALAERKTTRRVDHVVFVSQYDYDLAKAFGLLPQRSHFSVIYNGIQLEEIPEARMPQWDVGFVGRMEEPKDPLLFVEVMRLLPDLRGVMVGGGSLEAAVSIKIQSNGLVGRVEMIGSLSRRKTLEVLGQVRVLVMTSRWEGLPILPLEAMAAGVPVVATSVGGIPEVLAEGAGVLVKSRDPYALAEAVRKLLVDDAYREGVIQRGFKRVRAVFSEDVMLSKLKKLYNELIQSQSPQRKSRDY